MYCFGALGLLSKAATVGAGALRNSFVSHFVAVRVLPNDIGSV
jgi:hypothetical protein